MDLNPYRFEAPWHAFEFAFHLLEVRANLVIVTMAWLTREDSKSFTRMPNEPDMDTLTYWAQRLEPVIRNEDRDEVIVVFCNRTGIEDNACYAGTSTVIGIQEGEVKVYGLLGRGVKELLVVDTDDAPYAKLIQRDEGSHSHSEDYKPKPSRKGSSAGSSGSKSSSTKSGENPGKTQASKSKDKASPKKISPKTSPKTSQSRTNSSQTEMTEKRRPRRPSVKIAIPEQHYETTSSTDKMAGAVSPSIPTPTAPSPTPQSARPQLQVPGSRSAKDHIDTPYPNEDYYTKKGHIIGGSVTISSEEEHSEPETGPEKYFWMPSSSLLDSSYEPPRWAPHQVPLPPASPVVSSSLIKFPTQAPRKSGSSSHRDSSPKSEKNSSISGRSAKSGRASRSQKPSEQDKISPTRPATTTGVAPVRPSSPKSRNASRSGRQERRGSEVEEPDIPMMLERLEALRRRTQSAMSQRQEYSSTPSHERPRSPKSRNASRSGRPIDIDQAMLERALNLSRGSIPIGVSDSVLAATIQRPQSDILAKDHKLVNGSHVGLPQGVHQHHMADDQRPSSRNGGPLNRIDSPVAHIEPEESRTMLWSEISKIVGEHIGRPESREAPRGRQRNESISSTQARPGSRGAPNGGRTAPSQTRQVNGGGIRSVRYPSQGPPADPDDEIVAEIIFHRPGAPAQNSRSNSTEAVVGSEPSGRNSHQSQDGIGPTKDGSPSPFAKTDDRKRNSPPAHLKSTSGNMSISTPPDLSGVSVHTLNSTKTSPTTPPLRTFEPSTPKAMILGPDHGSLLSTTSDPLSELKFDQLRALLDDTTTVKIERPRSAMM